MDEIAILAHCCLGATRSNMSAKAALAQSMATYDFGELCGIFELREDSERNVNS